MENEFVLRSADAKLLFDAMDDLGFLEYGECIIDGSPTDMYLGELFAQFVHREGLESANGFEDEYSFGGMAHVMLIEVSIQRVGGFFEYVDFFGWHCICR